MQFQISFPKKIPAMLVSDTIPEYVLDINLSDTNPFSLEPGTVFKE